jgi:hypothetical protein
MKRARLILNHPGEPPFREPESISVIDTTFKEVLLDLGYDISLLWRERTPPPHIDNWVPIPAVLSALDRQSEPPCDLELRTNLSIQYFPFCRHGRQKNIVFFHALCGTADQWVGNRAIDRYWCNSDYLKKVVLSLLSTPDWSRRQLLEPRAFSIVSRITLPLPYLELPDGIPQEGAEELPPSVLAALESDDILGHCVAYKVDQQATFSIMLALNHAALQSGIGRRFRLFVEKPLYDIVQTYLQADEVPLQFRPAQAYLQQLHLTIDDVLIPFPRLAQSSLFKLLGACKFGLLYQWFPEPFGLLPLESICHGCPVYTNGAGNLRYLLPADCGIYVFETEGMAFGDTASYGEAAQRIFQNTVVDPKPAFEACRRGSEYIAANYTRQAMRDDLAARLAELDEPPSEHDLDSAKIALSPMVRTWNADTRRIVSDYQSVELSSEQAALLQEVLGQPCGGLECRRNPVAMEVVDGLFKRAIIAAFPPESPAEAPESATCFLHARQTSG